ncbi:MAG: 50S ribosomal protein L1 [Phycisphaerae bacterium]|jgi:large subunit ribosomal protein L1|nr:50S ribosomal protein L1 [Phycisphaerae bacterium]
MRKRGKRYIAAAKDLPSGPVSLSEAVKKVKSFPPIKFDQTVNCVVWLGIDPKQSDQIIRGSVSLPNGVGKSKKVVAFCEDSDVEAAKQAGAIEAGIDELVKKITGGWADFDVAIASPKVMGKVGRLGKVLGPQGKMPSPKNGTVTQDIFTAIKEFAAGKIEFKNDAGGNVHAVVGKLSFDENKLVENIQAFVALIKKMKPVSSKGTYIKKLTISATMSPGVQIDTTEK